jgi:hypothetical protein
MVKHKRSHTMKQHKRERYMSDVQKLAGWSDQNLLRYYEVVKHFPRKLTNNMIIERMVQRGLLTGAGDRLILTDAGTTVLKQVQIEETTGEATGAVCEDCRQHMLVADGCKLIPIQIYTEPEEVGKQRRLFTVLNPIKFGDEQQFGRDRYPARTERCHDCGALPGHYYHPGCDFAECPYCHGQLLQCAGEACESNGSLTPAARRAVGARKSLAATIDSHMPQFKYRN